VAGSRGASKTLEAMAELWSVQQLWGVARKMTAAAQAIGASKKLRVFLYNFTSTHALQNL
jgi:hypothetical protein